DGLEGLPADEGDLPDLGPGHAGDRVEIHPELVRMVEVLGSDRGRVEIDAAEVHHPGEPGRLVEDNLVGGPAGGERQLGRPEPVRGVVGRPFLEERLLPDPDHAPLTGYRAPVSERPSPW